MSTPPGISHLKALREAAGLTTRELATAAGLVQAQVWRYEHGATPKGLKLALALAAVLRCKVTDIWPAAAPQRQIKRASTRPRGKRATPRPKR